MCVCVCIRLRNYLKMVHCCSWKPKQEMVLISELQKERKWHNDEFSQQSNCCPSLDAPKLSSEWAGNLCVSLCLHGCQGGLWWRQSLSFPCGRVLCILWSTMCMESHCWFEEKIDISHQQQVIINSCPFPIYGGCSYTSLDSHSLSLVILVSAAHYIEEENET